MERRLRIDGSAFFFGVKPHGILEVDRPRWIVFVGQQSFRVCLKRLRRDPGRLLYQVVSGKRKGLVALHENLVRKLTVHLLQVRDVSSKIVNARRPRAVKNIASHATLVDANHVRLAGDVGQPWFLGWRVWINRKQRHVVGTDHDH